MVNCGGPTSVFGVFVTGLFRTCSRQYGTGMSILHELRDLCVDIHDAYDLAETVIQQIRKISPSGLAIYWRSFRFNIHFIFWNKETNSISSNLLFIMDTLPEELQLEIFCRIGSSGFRNLAPFISSSKTTSNAVFSPHVLKSVFLSEFVLHTTMLNKDSPYRSFFCKCVVAGNRTAVELEGLRILCQEGPYETAFRMVMCGGPNSVFGIFVTGIFRICLGEFERGLRTLHQLGSHVTDFAEAVQVADDIIDQIETMGAAGVGLYF